jgi:hypothetical protein
MATTGDDGHNGHDTQAQLPRTTSLRNDADTKDSEFVWAPPK